MKVILSRKAFDSGSGGVPNPHLPDGRIIPLPIPDKHSPIRYADVSAGSINVGQVVEQLTNGRIPRTHFAHLDPDLDPASIPRDPDWRPLFGQDGSAQGHLRNQEVGVGDLFLFFGLFRDVLMQGDRFTFAPTSRPFHALWGWLQVGRVEPVDSLTPEALPWARYHPHFNRPPSPNNVLYVAADELTIDGRACGVPGGGIWQQLQLNRLLTDEAASGPRKWRLPSWFLPTDGRPPLTFHGRSDLWTADGDHVFLETMARGQEFVLDAGQYPEAAKWLTHLWGLSSDQART